MIKKTKQVWLPGHTVKVGFLSLIVKAAVSTPGDSAPDAYYLTNAAGTKFYSFVPHNGLNTIPENEFKAAVAKNELVMKLRLTEK